MNKLDIFKITGILSIILSVFFSTTASACTCSHIPLNTETIKNSSNVFIFRLIGAKVKHASNSLATDVEGEIKVVERIRGTKYSYKRIHFSTSLCCGLRLDVGHYFVAFTSENGPTLSINSGNILDIGETYFSDARGEMNIKEKINKITYHNATLENFFPRADVERIEQLPVLRPCVQNKVK